MVTTLSCERLSIVYGGAERTDSVAAGCCALDDTITHVLIHDGARPFVSDQLIARVIERLKLDAAVIPAMPVSDTIKMVAENYVAKTMPRDSLRAVQTPQGFERQLFEKMTAFSIETEAKFSDDAAVAEALGETVYCVVGETFNIKVTTQQDLVWADAILQQGEKQ